MNMTRRVAVSGLCAAVAVPAPAQLALLQVEPTADADLVALGRQMDDLERLMADAMARAKPNWQAFYDACEHFGRPLTNEQFEEAWRVADEKHPIGHPNHDEVSDLMGPVVRRIMELPAHSIAGLAAKAKAAKSACPHFWKKSDEDADWDHQVARHLIDAVIKLGEAQA